METKKTKARADKPKADKPIVRNDKGQFLPGHSGGPGRPSQNVEREYLEATMMACSPQEWARIVRKAVEEAEDEDPKVRNMARGFLLKAMMGNSPSVVMQYSNVHLGITPEKRLALSVQIIRELIEFGRSEHPEALPALADMLENFPRYLSAKLESAK